MKIGLLLGEILCIIINNSSTGIDYRKRSQNEEEIQRSPDKNGAA